MAILGISAFYHDSAVALVDGADVIAAAQEERFTRRKHDAGFPRHALRYALAEARARDLPVEGVVFYEKPLLKFERLLQTWFSVAPRGLGAFRTAVPSWVRQKLWIPLVIEEALEKEGISEAPPLFFTRHHEAHAASAFLPSPFARAAILTVDGVGEWSTSTIGRGEGNRVALLCEQRFPHSLGLLYSAFTYYLGFKVNSGEYKVMGLAPYGEPAYEQAIRDHLVDLRDDGSFRLNLDAFGYLDDLVMTSAPFERLFGGPPRKPESVLEKRHADIARSIQAVAEEILLRMARHARALTGEDHLCLAGGVALNCVANGRILREGPFSDIWIQPAAGDAGGALGAALLVSLRDRARTPPTDANGTPTDAMRGSFLGPAFSDDEIRRFLDGTRHPYTPLDETERAGRAARLLADGLIVGLFDGRMEYGPRALGARSILGDARSPEMQTRLNLRIKYRESFRPFAPACLAERVGEWFALDRPSPYMLLVASVAERRLTPLSDSAGGIRERLAQIRSAIPAVTHVDLSARVQTVHRETNPRFHAILEAFEALTGCPVVVNTSFNVRGEPIVCTPEDAYRCFMRTEMDALLLGPFLLHKSEPPPSPWGVHP